MTNDPLFFGFFTRNTPYEQEFKAIEECYKALELDYEYIGIENRGSWLANCAAKAEIVGQILAKHPGRKCVYVDVDSLVITRPVMFWTLEADIAACLFDGNILMSGVMMFRGPKAQEVVELWRKLCIQYPKKLPDGRDAWDQRVLQMAIGMSPGVTFRELPPAYNYMCGLSQRRYPGINPVILATRGALRLHKSIDGKEQGE